MPKDLQHQLFDKIVDKDNLYNAYRKALKGDGKYNPEAIDFSLNETYNLKILKEDLSKETYVFDGYIRFPVFEPKMRIVDAPHFKDKIVQLAINNILKEVYNSKFIFDSYACIDDKGTHKCVDRIQCFMRKAKWEYGEESFIIKGDIRKFFYSIDREILKKLLTKGIKCKKTLRLIYKIIDSAEVIDLLGLPLGNTLSQIAANIYLNELDQYCKRKLGLKYYVRYMDDFIIIVPNKDEANRILGLIKEFTYDLLNIELNESKSKIFPMNQGVNAIGFKVYATHRLLRDDSKRRIKRKIKAMPHLIMEGELTIKKAEQMLNSWKGHAEHSNSFNFINKLIEKHNFIYKIKKGNREVLKINQDKLKEAYYGGLTNEGSKLSQLQPSYGVLD